MPQEILVIDDDNDMRDMLKIILAEHGFRVHTASDALSGLRLAYQERPDAIVMDVMMPDMDGFEACRRLREMMDAPIMLLTGQQTTTSDIVKGLDLGADEYMTKPFAIPELISRLRVCLRRSNATPREAEAAQYLFPTPSVILDCGRHILTVHGKEIYLSPSEFEVLFLLIRHTGRPLSPNAILSQVWGPQRIGDDRLVKQYIYQLRKKIEPDPSTPTYIQTIRGEGYYFTVAEPDYGPDHH
jgi:DNA-binding response OmpR family regulator